MSSHTKRLSLDKFDLTEDISACRDNWNRLDKGYSGAIWVSPGTFPDRSLLFDGAIIAETTTGKIWRAMRNSDGSYRQEWIKYPWMWVGGRSGTYNTTGSWNRFPMTQDQIIAAQCVNADANSLDSNGSVIIPIDGIYTYAVRCKFNVQAGNTAGIRGIGLAFNNSTNPAVPATEVQHLRNPAQVALQAGVYAHVLRGTKSHVKGTKIVPTGYNSGAAYNPTTVDCQLFIALNTPTHRHT